MQVYPHPHPRLPRHGHGRSRAKVLVAVMTTLLVVVGVLVVAQFRLLVETSKSTAETTTTTVSVVTSSSLSSSTGTTSISTGSNSSSHRSSEPKPIPTRRRNRLAWTEDGCLHVVDDEDEEDEVEETTKTTPSNNNSENIHRHNNNNSNRPPPGLVVTLALAPMNRQHLLTARKQICDNLPNQWAFFLYPQQIDMLLVIQEEPVRNKRWTVPHFVECLNLTVMTYPSSSLLLSSTLVDQNDGSNTTITNNDTSGQPRQGRIWHNLDGSIMETTEYLYYGPILGSSTTRTTGNGSKNDNAQKDDTETKTTTTSSSQQQQQQQQSPPPITIHIGTTVVRYPQYIRDDPSLLELRNMLGPAKGCSGRLRYLQGCRWYTQEMLHLQILHQQKTITMDHHQHQQHHHPNHIYQYFIKMDTDIVFHKSPPFFLLHDMERKGAVFAHTGEYHPVGDGSCAAGIIDAIHNFTTTRGGATDWEETITTTMMTTTARTRHQEQHNHPNDDGNLESHSSWNKNIITDTETNPFPPWRGSICSNQSPIMDRNADQYYGNFIIGRVEYFTSPWVLQFGRFLSNYPHGFFENKWGDQIFWHFAMGLFLTGRHRDHNNRSANRHRQEQGVGGTGPSFSESVSSFTDYVVDYTDLRCKPNPQCWYSFAQVDRYGQNASVQCNNDDGIFVHTKDTDFVTSVREEMMTTTMMTSTLMDDVDVDYTKEGLDETIQRMNATLLRNTNTNNAAGTITGRNEDATGGSLKYRPMIPFWHQDLTQQPMFLSRYTGNCSYV